MPEARPLTTPGLFGIVAGLAVVALAVAALAIRSGAELGPEAGQEALEARFDIAGPFPGGFEVRAARQISGAELYVSLTLPGELPEELAPLPFEGKVAPRSKKGWGRPKKKSGDWGSASRTDWKKVALRGEGAPPLEARLLFVEGKEDGDALLTAQFGRIRFKDIDHLASEGEALPIDSGHLDWNGYEATWIQLRHYELTEDRTPTCHDTFRVNLTTTGEARVLYLRWPRGYTGDVSAAEEWLSVLTPRG